MFNVNIFIAVLNNNDVNNLEKESLKNEQTDIKKIIM